jgi:hypothetical protein
MQHVVGVVEALRLGQVVGAVPVGAVVKAGDLHGENPLQLVPHVIKNRLGVLARGAPLQPDADGDQPLQVPVLALGVPFAGDGLLVLDEDELGVELGLVRVLAGVLDGVPDPDLGDEAGAADDAGSPFGDDVGADGFLDGHGLSITPITQGAMG